MAARVPMVELDPDDPRDRRHSRRLRRLARVRHPLARRAEEALHRRRLRRAG